jgi:hypothetical protein
VKKGTEIALWAPPTHQIPQLARAQGGKKPVPPCLQLGWVICLAVWTHVERGLDGAGGCTRSAFALEKAEGLYWAFCRGGKAEIKFKAKVLGDVCPWAGFSSPVCSA